VVDGVARSAHVVTLSERLSPPCEVRDRLDLATSLASAERLVAHTNAGCPSIWLERWPAPRRPLPRRLRRGRRAASCQAVNPDRPGDDEPSQVGVAGQQQTGTVGRLPDRAGCSIAPRLGGGGRHREFARVERPPRSPLDGVFRPAPSTQIEKERPLGRRVGEIRKLASSATGGLPGPLRCGRTREAGRALRAKAQGRPETMSAVQR
jgi:hypothetical protein